MFADKKQKAIEQFHEYLAACDTLYATKKQGGGDCELSANNLEKKMGRMADGYQYHLRIPPKRGEISSSKQGTERVVIKKPLNPHIEQ